MVIKYLEMVIFLSLHYLLVFFLRTDTSLEILLSVLSVSIDSYKKQDIEVIVLKDARLVLYL